MQITVILDEDVAAKLRAEACKTSETFNKIVNRVLRTGLNARAQAASLTPYKIKARSLGTPGFN